MNKEDGLFINGTTRLYGLLADPVDHLRAHAALNDLCKRRGVDAVCVPLHVVPQNLKAVVAGLRCLKNFSGFGVTIPHKETAAELCDELMPNARACGSVNIIRIDQGGRLIGETFDGIGMVRAIETQRVLDSKTRVLQIGAGGVGSAIAVALGLEGVGYLAIVNRTGSKADDLARTVRDAAPACMVESGSDFDPADFDIVVNATSLGLNGQGPLPIDVSRVPLESLVAEVVMVPEITPLLEATQKRGLAVVTGREMLLHELEVCADFLGMTN